MRATIVVMVMIAATIAAACQSGNEDARAAPTSTSAPPAPAPADTGCASQRALDKLDSRSSVPLLPMMANHQKQNMRDHLAVVQEVVAGIAASDYAAIEKAAGRMGFSEQMGAMCSHMGAGAPGFTEQAIAFHKTADSIADAARKHDRDGVTRALATTLATCTGCHSTWKQQVVDEEALARATGGAAPMPHAPEHSPTP